MKRSEVEKIAAGGRIVEETHFPQSVLTYGIDTVAEGPCSASFDQGSLVVHLPMSEVRQWAQTDRVSIVGEQPVGQSGVLSLLIEKDFECLAPGEHRHDEDDADTYPHPQAGTQSGCA